MGARKTCSRGLLEDHWGESERKSGDHPDRSVIYECFACFCRAHKEEKTKEAEPGSLGFVLGNKVKMINLNTIFCDHIVSSEFVLFVAILLSEQHCFLPNWH